jgi:hypothetical protein
MKSRESWVAIVVLLCLAPALGTAQGRLDADTIRQDTRLDNAVSLQAPSLYVGAMLERLSKLSGVELHASENDGAADELVSIYADKVPLHEVMEALWSLLSYRQAEWKWVRSGSSDSYVYTLERPRPARELASKLRAMIQDEFEHDVRLLIQAAHAQPNERRTIIRRYVNESAGGDQNIADWLLQPSADSVWLGLRLFATLSSEMQNLIMRGETEQRLLIRDLPSNVQSMAKELQAATYKRVRRADGTPVEPPTLDAVYVRVKATSNPPTPSLWIDFGTGPGFSYAGGKTLQDRVKTKLKKMWMLEEDTDAAQGQDMAMKPPANEPLDTAGPVASFPPSGMLSFSKRIGQVARARSVCIIARPPADQVNDPGSPYGRTLKEFLDRLDGKGVFAKRSGRILVLASTDWYSVAVTGAAIPWAAARKLGLEGDNKRVPTLLDVADFSTLGLSRQQADRVCEIHREYAAVRFWPALFLLIAKRPQHLEELVSPGGLKYTQIMWSQLFAVGSGPKRVDPNIVNAIRIRHTSQDDRNRASGYDIELRLRVDGTWKRLMHVP